MSACTLYEWQDSGWAIKVKGVTKNLEQGLEKIEPLTVDLPSLELETPKRTRKMVMVALDYTSSNASGDY